MKFIVILFAILGLTICTKDISGAERMQMVNAFKSLLKSDMGRDLFTTISLELSTGKGQNIVDKIVDMLYSLQKSFNDNKSEFITKLGRIQGQCATKLSGLIDEIQELKDKISLADVTFPTLQDQIDSKQAQVDLKKSEQNNNQALLVELDDKDLQAREKYKLTVEEHNNMIEVLNEAKRLIAQLAVKKGIFVQTNSQENILAQIEKHFSKIAPKKKLNKAHNKSLFNVLLNLAKSVAPQANQQQVSEILAIIDDLINYELKSKQIEKNVESQRQKRHEYDRNRIVESDKFIDSQLKDLVGGLKTSETRYKELKSDIVTWKAHIKSKNQQSSDTKAACDDQVSSLEKGVKQSNEHYDLLTEIIAIFRSKPIQDIRAVVADINA